MYTKQEWQKAYNHLLEILNGNMRLQQEYLYWYASYNIPIEDLLKVKRSNYLKFKHKIYNNRKKEIPVDFLDEKSITDPTSEHLDVDVDIKNLVEFSYYLSIKEQFILNTYVDIKKKHLPVTEIMLHPFSERGNTKSFYDHLGRCRKKFKKYLSGDLKINSYYIISSPYYDIIKYVLNYEQFRIAEEIREAKRTFNDFRVENYSVVANNIVIRFIRFMQNRPKTRSVNIFLLKYIEDVPFLNDALDLLTAQYDGKQLVDKFWYYYEKNYFYETYDYVQSKDMKLLKIKKLVNKAYREWVRKELQNYDKYIKET